MNDFREGVYPLSPTRKMIATLAGRNQQKILGKRIDSETKTLRNKLAKAEKDAYTDSLTGLYTRRYFNEQLDHHVKEAMRYNQPLSILLLDLDDLREVNNQYGHDAGDLLLVNAGAIILKNIRGSDICCRIGGDEIAVILPETNIETSRIISERVRSAIENNLLGLLSQDNRLIKRNDPVTVSIGCAIYKDEIDRELFFKKADIALYNSKHGNNDGKKRKNMVTVYEEGMKMPEQISEITEPDSSNYT